MKKEIELNTGFVIEYTDCQPPKNLRMMMGDGVGFYAELLSLAGDLAYIWCRNGQNLLFSSTEHPKKLAQESNEAMSALVREYLLSGICPIAPRELTMFRPDVKAWLFNASLDESMLGECVTISEITIGNVELNSYIKYTPVTIELRLTKNQIHPYYTTISTHQNNSSSFGPIRRENTIDLLFLDKEKAKRFIINKYGTRLSNYRARVKTLQASLARMCATFK